MCRNGGFAFDGERLPSFRHGQQLQALIFVLGVMGKGVALAGVPPISGRLVKGLIAMTQLDFFGAAAGYKNAAGKPQIVGHAALPTSLWKGASATLVNKR